MFHLSLVPLTKLKSPKTILRASDDDAMSLAIKSLVIFLSSVSEELK